MISNNYRSSRQLDFIAVSDSEEIFVGASNLINSGNWNGELVYYPTVNDIPSKEDIFKSENGIKYSVYISVSDGTFLGEKKVIVGNDCGMLALYTVGGLDAESENDKMSFYNNVCAVEHSRTISSISVSPNSSKAVTGGMDRMIKIWDLENFVVLSTYMDAHNHHVTSVRFKNLLESENAEGSANVFLSTSLDGYCLLWDSRQQYPAQIISRNNTIGYSTAEWIASTEYAFLGCEDGSISLCDIRYPEKNSLQNFNFLNTYVNKIVSFKKNSDTYLAVASDSRIINVFQFIDDNSLNSIYEDSSHNDYVKGLAWINKPNEETLLSCSWDSHIVRHQPFKNLIESS